MSDGAKQLYWLLFAVVVIMGAILALRFILPEPAYETREYNGFDFTNVDNAWYFEWQHENIIYEVGLRYAPWEVEDVPIRGVLNGSFNQKKVYITHDPDLGENSRNFTVIQLGAVELASSMASSLNLLPISACTVNTSSCVASHIVTCDSNGSVVYMTDIGSAGVVLNQNCITLRGENMELIKSIDRLLYQWYGIMGGRWT
ncbi:MAG: hypothetical protein ACE5FT_03785 [Candidatus Nanoarchaeia archaeon]